MNYFSAIPVVPDFIPASNVPVIHYRQSVLQPARGGVSQTTTTTTQTAGVNVGVGVNVGGVSMGISINDGMSNGVVSQTTTTTNHSNNVIIEHNEPIRGCGGPSCMTAGNFNAAMATIKGQNFEKARLQTAKQVITANFLTVDQIIKIANTFNFEDNKLKFSKYAYDFCIEPRNYSKLNRIFSFSSNVDELSDYVQSRHYFFYSVGNKDCLFKVVFFVYIE